MQQVLIQHNVYFTIFVYIPQNNCNPGQLYSKLFDEVEKVKSWKVKVDSDTLQKERRLQENKRTIETQRKAIQELQVCASVLASLEHYFHLYQRIILMILFVLCVLSSQFGSESLSVKLEEQISENEDLRNKYESCCKNTIFK